MKVAGENRSGAVELVNRMEGSKHFQNTQLIQEGQSTTQIWGNVPDASTLGFHAERIGDARRAKDYHERLFAMCGGALPERMPRR